MNVESEKCVIILDEQLPIGAAANTAAILGVTIGMRLPDVVGRDVCDAAGRAHAGIIRFPIPVLKASPEKLAALRETLYLPGYEEVTAVDFSSLAQECRTYGEFTGKISLCPPQDLRYIGLALCGDKKKINRLTGNLPLLR